MDMRVTSEEKRDFSTPRPPQAPEYPYGLRITLGPDELKKLGISEAPELGKMIKLMAEAKVVEVEVANQEGDSSDFKVELQIQHLEFQKKEENKSTSSIIYGG
jgi:hypothetical protein